MYLPFKGRRIWPVLGTMVLVAVSQALPQAAHAGGDPSILEARGCYYYRGRQYCGRYCYWEVNGRRYCRERERDAFPQGPVDSYEAAPVYERRGPAILK